ncbi:MAG: MlaD family protein [Verrucomicrobiota bacterium]
MQDLTPQLRTRLGRVERAVGLFVLFATLLLLAGFFYYLQQTAKRKGWFETKVTYCTELNSSAGLKVGDPVTLWGFNVGSITKIDTEAPDKIYNVYVEFNIRAPYFGYVWTEGSIVRIAAADFLGKRALEVTKGTNYCPTHLVWPVRTLSVPSALHLADLTNQVFLDAVTVPGTNAPLTSVLQAVNPETLQKLAAAGVTAVRLADRSREQEMPTMVWNFISNRYQTYIPGEPVSGINPYWLVPEESPALTERLDGFINQVGQVITAQLPALLSNTVSLTSNANQVLARSQPLLSNLTLITANLTNADGSFGQWFLPTNLHAQLLVTLTNADGTLTSASLALTNASQMMLAANSNLAVLVNQLQPSLGSMATMMSNANLQVQANTNFVTTLSSLLHDTDTLIEGLKRHWLFRSAFKEKPTNAPPKKSPAKSR